MKILFTTLLLITLFSTCLHSQDVADTDTYLYYPEPYNNWKYVNSVGITIGKLPKFIVDDQINQVPMLYYHGRFGLPLNFSVNAIFNTNVLTNHISAGASWHFNKGRFSFSLCDNMAFWYGFAYFDYFNSTIYGLINYPTISIGYDFGKLRATLKNEVALMMYLSKKIDNIEVLTQKDQIVNASSSLILEQPLWNENVFILGIKLNYTRYYYQSWLAYTTNQVWLFIPEFLVGLII